MLWKRSLIDRGKLVRIPAKLVGEQPAIADGSVLDRDDAARRPGTHRSHIVTDCAYSHLRQQDCGREHEVSDPGRRSSRRRCHDEYSLGSLLVYSYSSLRLVSDSR